MARPALATPAAAPAVRRRWRLISTMMAVLILVAIVAFVGAMLFSMAAGFLRGGGRAVLVLSAAGSGSSDGTLATVNLVIRNTGDAAARVFRIYVAPESAGLNLTDARIAGFDAYVVLLENRTLPRLPSITPEELEERGWLYEDVDARSSKTAYLQVQGRNLYAGAQLRIYVVYFDLGSRQLKVADTVVTLR